MNGRFGKLVVGLALAVAVSSMLAILEEVINAEESEAAEGVERNLLTLLGDGWRAMPDVIGDYGRRFGSVISDDPLYRTLYRLELAGRIETRVALIGETFTRVLECRLAPGDGQFTA